LSSRPGRIAVLCRLDRQSVLILKGLGQILIASVAIRVIFLCASIKRRLTGGPIRLGQAENRKEKMENRRLAGRAGHVGGLLLSSLGVSCRLELESVLILKGLGRILITGGSIRLGQAENRKEKMENRQLAGRAGHMGGLLLSSLGVLCRLELESG